MKIIRTFVYTVFMFCLLMSFTSLSFAQTNRVIFTFPSNLASSSASTAASITQDPTPTSSPVPVKPQQVDQNRIQIENQNRNIQALFSQRPLLKPTWINFIAYFVQYAVKIGVPADTVIFILLLPLLATIIAFSRQIIGLPNLGILVSVSFSITFLTIGITPGLIILAAIILASTVGRFVLKKVRIMQLPKMALSVFGVAIFVFIALVVSGSLGLLIVSDLSIFPILLLILLGERIVALQLERPTVEALIITFITLFLGILGYFILSSIDMRKFILLYPESIFLLVPINVLIGRYFGLRLTEYFRFRQILYHGSK